MKIDNDLEKFKKKYKDKLSSRYNYVLLLTVLGELEKAYGQRRAIFKWKAIASKIREMYEEILSKHYKDGIDKTLNEIHQIGLFFKYPDTRGVLRRKKAYLPKELSDEYHELRETLNKRLKRRYRNPNTKKLNLSTVLTETLNLNSDLIKGHIEKLVNLNLSHSEIALEALAFKYKVSKRTIKSVLYPKSIKR